MKLTADACVKYKYKILKENLPRNKMKWRRLVTPYLSNSAQIFINNVFEPIYRFWRWDYNFSDFIVEIFQQILLISSVAKIWNDLPNEFET